jgi:hypothetical protein
VEAIGEDVAVLGGAVVVLAGGDVAAASGAVHLEDAGVVGLAAGAGEADEVARHGAVAVGAHGVDGVGMQGGEGLVVVPETEGAQEGVDASLGLGLGVGVAGGAASGEGGRAVGEEVAAVGGDPIDRGAAEADLRHRAGGGEARLQVVGDAPDRLFVEVGVADAPFRPVGAEQALGFEVDDGGVVLVDAVDEDAIRGGPGGLGQEGPPAAEGVVADLAPIDGDDDQGAIGAEQHDAAGQEGVEDLGGGLDAAAHAGVAEWDGDVGREGGEAEALGG